MIVRFFAGVIITFIALILQFFFLSIGVTLSLAFAAAIAFAFAIDFLPLLVLTLFAAFAVNWQPAASPEIIVLIAFPVVAYLFRNIIHWERWVQCLGAVILGFLILYTVAAVGGSFPAAAFAADLIGGLIFAAGSFFALNAL